jgi:hypothetical protein
MNSVPKIMILAPFWRQTGHVGCLRVERFLRWLGSAGARVALVCAGKADWMEQRPWGMEIGVRDPLGLYPGDGSQESHPGSSRRTSQLRRQAAYWLFNPDPTVAWAFRAARHDRVREQARDCQYVLSTSPPESAHVAAAKIARENKAVLCVDLRDGWLDEPLKTYLRHPGFRTWREQRLEARILQSAQHIFVSSAGWRDLLEGRRPSLKGRVTVLTNCYPLPDLLPDRPPAGLQPVSSGRDLIYTGQIGASRHTQKIEFLFDPLLQAFPNRLEKGTVHIYGRLAPHEAVEFPGWQQRFSAVGWALDHHPPVSRHNMLARLCQADGILLLSLSMAAIPCKLFEYIPSGKPILCITPRNSAVWQVGAKTRQMHLADSQRSDQYREVVDSFMEHCGRRQVVYDTPGEYSDDSVRKIFLEQLLGRSDPPKH